jgi:hypothetical protein
MRRDETLALLREHKPVLAERFGVVDLALFGSTARGEAGPESDIDVLVTLARQGPWGSPYGEVLHYLEGLFDRSVDLVVDSDLRAEFRPYVEKDAVHV